MFDATIKNAPQNAMAYYYKAICILETGSKSGEESDLLRAAAGYSDDADAWVKTQAEEYLVKAIALNSKLLPAKLVLAEIYLSRQDIEKARIQINDILSSSPTQENALTLEGSLKLLEKDYEGAVAVCRKVLDKDPENSQWLTRLGVIYLAMQQQDKASDAFQQALTLNPLQFDALRLLIGLYLGEKEYENVVALCEAHKVLLKDRPDSVAIINYLEGGALFAKGDSEQARGLFRMAADGSPEFISPRMALAKLDVSAQNYESAISELEGILKIDESYLPACMALGDLYYMQGDKTKAGKYYRTALKIDSGYGQAANNLAYVLSSSDRNLREALSLALTAVKKLPDDATARDTLGWIHYRMGDYYSAIAELEKSLSINPKNASASYHLGLAYYKNRDFEKARQYFARSLELNPNFEDADEAKAMLDRKE